MLLEVVCERTDPAQVKADGRRAYLGHVTSPAIAEQLVELYRAAAAEAGIERPAFWIREISKTPGGLLV